LEKNPKILELMKKSIEKILKFKPDITNFKAVYILLLIKKINTQDILIFQPLSICFGKNIVQYL
jgi:hypothetical protein